MTVTLSPFLAARKHGTIQSKNILRRVLFTSLQLCAALATLSAETSLHSQPLPRGDDASLVRAINAILDIPELKAGFQGLLVQSLKDGRALYELNAEKNFLPASNNKLLTSCIALEKLGSDFVYETQVMRTGDIGRDGTLRGDLVLFGVGDPLLMPDDLQTLAKKVREAGIRRVTGSLRYADYLFDDQRLGTSWSWDDEPFAYSAQVSALNVNRNVVTALVKPGKREGEKVIVQITPTDRYMIVNNDAFTGTKESKPSITFDRERGANVLKIKGNLPFDTPVSDFPTVQVTVENPPLFAATLFLDYLKQQGVRVWKRNVAVATYEVNRVPVLVARHVSPPLPEILKRLNKPSDNLVAECLLKSVGVAHQKDPIYGSTKSGAEAARHWFLRIGLDVESVRMDDGSGLARTDYVTPRNLVRLLTYMHASERFPIFFDSLPIAGVDGTLRNRMKDTSAANNCRAKTGSLSFVSSLSGYVKTKEGELLVFSILMNNHLAPASVARAAQDKIVTLLADYMRSEKSQQD